MHCFQNFVYPTLWKFYPYVIGFGCLLYIDWLKGFFVTTPFFLLFSAATV